MGIKDEKEMFEKNVKVYDSAILKFNGIDGFDVYNCTVPFFMNGKKYMFGRVEKRNQWARSWVRLFTETGKDEYTLVPDSMIYQLEDPYISFIKDELVMGGTHPTFNAGELEGYRGYFYRGTDINDLLYFTTGPMVMKDIRLVELPEGIGVFSRPEGRVGFTIIKDLNELSAQVIENAPLIDAVEEAEYGGCNECHYLGNGLIGIIGHQAYSQTEIKRVYVNTAYVMDIKTRKIIMKKIIGTRGCYPASDAVKPSIYGTDLGDVAFTSGIVLRDDKKVDLYSGLCDAQEGRITIDDPFLEYRK